MDSKIRYSVTQEELIILAQHAAQTGAETGIAAYNATREETQRKAKSKKLRNTKLLLRNFKTLKANAQDSVFGRTQMKESAADILESMMNIYNDEIIVESIKRSASRTAIIVSHVENMLKVYEKQCNKCNDMIQKRRWEILKKSYLDVPTLTAEEIAENFVITKETVYKDINIACKALSALIFGIDGLLGKEDI